MFRTTQTKYFLEFEFWGIWFFMDVGSFKQNRQKLLDVVKGHSLVLTYFWFTYTAPFLRFLYYNL